MPCGRLLLLRLVLADEVDAERVRSRSRLFAGLGLAKRSRTAMRRVGDDDYDGVDRNRARRSADKHLRVANGRV